MVRLVSAFTANNQASWANWRDVYISEPHTRIRTHWEIIIALLEFTVRELCVCGESLVLTRIAAIYLASEARAAPLGLVKYSAV